MKSSGKHEANMKVKKKQSNIQRIARALRQIVRALKGIEQAMEKKRDEEADEAIHGAQSWHGDAQMEMDDAKKEAQSWAREVLILLTDDVLIPDSIDRKRLIEACEAVRQDDDFDTPEVRKAIDSADFLIRDAIRKGFRADQRADVTDSDQDTYICQEKIHINGEFDNDGRNLILVNDSTILLGHKQLHLLLIFVAGLQSKEEGWVDPEELIPLRYDPAKGKYQPLSVLRQKLEPALLECDPQHLFELGYDREGARHYRLSVQPDLVTCNWAKLLDHPDLGIRTLASTVKKDVV